MEITERDSFEEMFDEKLIGYLYTLEGQENLCHEELFDFRVTARARGESRWNHKDSPFDIPEENEYEHIGLEEPDFEEDWDRLGMSVHVPVEELAEKN